MIPLSHFERTQSAAKSPPKVLNQKCVSLRHIMQSEWALRTHQVHLSLFFDRPNGRRNKVKRRERRGLRTAEF
jgi:hypothetical protein